MNPLSSAFANLYVACGLLACIAVLLRLTLRLSSGARLLSVALLCPLIVMYLAGMHRSAGIDFDTYSDAYYDRGQPIPDPGYTALTWLTRSLGIDFSTFLLCQGVFTLAVWWVVAEAKRADPVVVLAVYLLHLAVVRDLSQSRIGLAVAVYLLGQTRQRALPRALLYVFAASVHVTVVVLMAVWTWVRMTSPLRPSRQALFVYLPLAAFAAGGVILLNIASGLDPRIEIYLSWDDVGYGAPLESFGALGRGILVVAVYLAASRRFAGLRLRDYVVMELAGAVILIGFAQFSIFAARLSNVAISMYPIGLGLVAVAWRRQPPIRGSISYGIAARAAFLAAMATLLVRPGSFDALLEVMPTMFERLAG